MQLEVLFVPRDFPALAVLRGRCHGVASSVCFLTPFVRHIFYATGVRPATRESIAALLSAGKAVVVIPGGVQEVL